MIPCWFIQFDIFSQFDSSPRSKKADFKSFIKLIRVVTAAAMAKHGAAIQEKGLETRTAYRFNGSGVRMEREAAERLRAIIIYQFITCCWLYTNAHVMTPFKSICIILKSQCHSLKHRYQLS